MSGIKKVVNACKFTGIALQYIRFIN